MSETADPLSALQLKALFLVWGTPDKGPRSRVLAFKLGIEVYFVYAKLPRGLFFVPLRYALQAVKTLLLLFRERPKAIFVQSPPLLAVLLSYFFCALTGADYLVDAHSAAFMGPWWTVPPTWLKRFLARRAITTMVTNEHLKQVVNDQGGHSFVLRDVPTTFDVTGEFAAEDGFNVALINTFAPDEPLCEVLQAATDLPDVNFYVTGRLNGKNLEHAEKAPANVHFTDFLPDSDYYSLLNTVQTVMCLTTRNHTMQRGACEALWLGKPIITSDWPILRRYFNKGTVHVDHTAEGIRQGVLQMKERYASFEAGIKTLQQQRQREWLNKINLLVSLIKERLNDRQGKNRR